MLTKIEEIDEALYKTIIFMILFVILIGVIVFITFGVANDEAEIAYPALFISLLVATMIFVNSLIAYQFYLIANLKGHKHIAILRWSFWVPIAGYLMVIALPDRAKPNAKGDFEFF